MAKLQLTLPDGVAISHGKQVTFKIPSDCINITGVVIDGNAYDIYDTAGNNIKSKSFTAGTMISIIVDMEDNKAVLISGASEAFFVKISGDEVNGYTCDKPMSDIIEANLSDKIVIVKHGTSSYVFSHFSVFNPNIVIPYGRMCGDVNCDGVIDQADVDRLYNHCNGTDVITDEIQLLQADVNGDGKINTTDIQRIYYYLNEGIGCGSMGAEATGNWTNIADASIEDYQFYTDIAVDGITPTSDVTLTIPGLYESDLFSTECLDGAIRVYAKLCPISDVNARLIFSSEGGIGAASVMLENVATFYKCNISNTDDINYGNISIITITEVDGVQDIKLQNTKLSTKEYADTMLSDAKTYVDNSLADFSTKPYEISETEPANKNLFWIDSANGNFMKAYKNEEEGWVPISAAYG